MPDVAEYLDALLRDNFDVSEQVEPHATLEELGVDSVAAIELIDILQEKFSIRIGDEELTTAHTVEHVVNTVRTKVGGA
jgi:acyl carrier protein